SGRFVADQVAALQGTGAVRPSVVAFENAAVRGPGELREQQAAAIASNVAASLRAGSPFVRGGAAGARSVPVARLAVAAGETPATGPDHRAVHRTAPLMAILDGAGGPDWALVHAHVGYPEGAAGAAVAQRLGVPLVVTEHASFLSSLLADPFVRDRYRRTMRAADRVIAVSAVLAREVADVVPEIAGSIVVIPNAVAVDEFTLGRDGDRVRGELLFVGARPASKGIETLLRAFARVHASRPTATLRLVGPRGPQNDAAWAALAARLGVSGSVRFEPAADRGGVAAAMARADLFVHPSPRETFGVVAVEALAAGLPVVATRSGGVDEILGEEPDRYGAIVPAGDPDALAAGILDTLDRRSSFDADRLREHVVSRFAADRVARRIVDVYDEILAETPGAVRDRAPASTAWRLPARQRASSLADRRTIVVGFSRLELDRALTRFPPSTFAGLVVVTTGDPIAGWPADAFSSAGERAAGVLNAALDWGGPAQGLPRRAMRWLSRRLRRAAARAGGRPASELEPLLRQLADALERHLPEAGGPTPPLVVCLAGIDHLVAAPFVAAGRAVAAPGGPRWLADARAEAQRVAVPDAGDRSSET
ncbi:MAG TPA: glycosyltransferase, partial [Candidatus Limnocylindrales bacterium]